MFQVRSNRHLWGGFAAESSLQCDTWQQESDDSGDLFVLPFCLFAFLLFCNDILGSKVQATFLLIVFFSFRLLILCLFIYLSFAMISLAASIMHDLGENIIICSSFVKNIRKWEFGFATTQEQMTKYRKNKTLLRT